MNVPRALGSRSRSRPRSRSRLTVLRVVLATCVTGAGAVAFGGAGCVNLEGDYTDFQNRTADVRGAVMNMPEAAPVDAQTPTMPFMGHYFASCLPGFVGGTLTDALLFDVEVSFTPTTGGAGTIDLTLQPLQKNATDLSQKVGMAVTKTGNMVTPDAHFEANLGNPTIDKAANPIATADIVFGDMGNPAVEHGILLSVPKFCTSLTGKVTSPLPVDLSSPPTYCVFISVMQESGPPPTPVAGDYHCP